MCEVWLLAANWTSIFSRLKRTLGQLWSHAVYRGHLRCLCSGSERGWTAGANAVDTTYRWTILGTPFYYKGESYFWITARESSVAVSIGCADWPVSQQGAGWPVLCQKKKWKIFLPAWGIGPPEQRPVCQKGNTTGDMTWNIHTKNLIHFSWVLSAKISHLLFSMINFSSLA